MSSNRSNKGRTHIQVTNEMLSKVARKKVFQLRSLHSIIHANLVVGKSRKLNVEKQSLDFDLGVK